MEGMTRTGYLHALEGVIAALIVVIYLSSIVQPPSPVDWTPTHLSKESEDVLQALDRSGHLDRFVLRNDRDSFNTLLSSLDSSLSYHVSVTGLPRPRVRVGVGVKDADTFVNTSSPGNWTEAAGEVGSSEHGYRKGNLSGPVFGDVPFGLTDKVENGVFKYTDVFFDFDNDGIYSGPYQYNSRFCRDTSEISGCYEIGPFNTTLRLYNASVADRLEREVGNGSVGRRTTLFTYDTVNPALEELAVQDAVLLPGWNTSDINAQQDRFEDFLSAGNVIVVMADVAETMIDGTVLADLGFDFMQGKKLMDSTVPRTNLLYSLHGAGNTSYEPNNYYVDSTLDLRQFTDQGTHVTGTLTLRGRDIMANVSNDGNTVSFGHELFAINYTEGDSVVIAANEYRIDQVKPLQLNPIGQQRFEGFGTDRIDAAYHLTRVEQARFNTSEGDAAANYSRDFQNRTDLPDTGSGVVDTDCHFSTEPYRLGYINITHTNVTFLLVNFELSTPCDEYFEFAYFDFADDDDFNDQEPGETPLGYAGEGPYQARDSVEIKNSTYTVHPFLNGNGTRLKIAGPRIVGEVPVGTGVINDQGTTALFGRRLHGQDEHHLLRTLLLYTTRERTRLTQPKDLGETSLGYTYSSGAGEENQLPYTLHTVWWYQ